MEIIIVGEVAIVAIVVVSMFTLLRSFKSDKSK